MSPTFDLYTSRIGPFHFDDGPTVMYATFDPDGDAVDVDVARPADDGAALRRVAETFPDARLACSSELAASARNTRFEVLPMPVAVAEARATVALLATWQTRDTVALDVADRVARACRPFFDAAPWRVIPESKRRRTTWEMITDSGRTVVEGTLQILDDTHASGPGIIVRDTHDGGLSFPELSGMQMTGRLRVTLSTEPTCTAATMHDAYGLGRFPRVANVCNEILFPPTPLRLQLAAHALRAAAGLAKAPSEPAVVYTRLEALLIRFTIHPGDVEPRGEAGAESEEILLRALTRDAAHELFRIQPGIRLGSDCVLCSGFDDPVAQRLVEADAKARRAAGDPPAKMVRIPKDQPVIRASWVRLPPILKLVQQKLGPEVVSKFMAENAVDSIRVLMVFGKEGEVYDVERDPTEVRNAEGTT